MIRSNEQELRRFRLEFRGTKKNDDKRVPVVGINVVTVHAASSDAAKAMLLEPPFNYTAVVVESCEDVTGQIGV